MHGNKSWKVTENQQFDMSDRWTQSSWGLSVFGIIYSILSFLAFSIVFFFLFVYGCVLFLYFLPRAPRCGHCGFSDSAGGRSIGWRWSAVHFNPRARWKQIILHGKGIKNMKRGGLENQRIQREKRDKKE